MLAGPYFIDPFGRIYDAKKNQYSQMDWQPLANRRS
jgi:hypothetical protein